MKHDIETDVLIIGAGLTGLTAAYFLKDSGLKVTIVESRARLGGRIHTLGHEKNEPIEMGATWLGKKHEHLNKLLLELGIETFEQIIGEKAIYEAISTSPFYLATLPPNPEPSLRIKGGTFELIQKLAAHVAKADIILKQRIHSIKDKYDYVIVESDDYTFTAKKVIATLPPNLLLNKINFTPTLPSDLIHLSKNTHTWMGESIKIALSFPTPFWKNENTTGTIFSNVGPIPEMYDHSNYEASHYSLMGFFNGNYYGITKEERKEKVLNQLKKYYGDVIDNYTAYHEVVWRKEPDTFCPHEAYVVPHQNNGHALYQKPYMDNKLFIAGTEMSTVFPGYMEGAVYSALTVSQFLKENRIKKDIC